LAPVRFRLGSREYAGDARLVMAIVNRTTDSFYDRGLTWEDTAAYARVRQVVAEGADLVDIGGIKAAPGAEVPVEEELRRVVPFVEGLRAEFPDLTISVDTYRAVVADAVLAAGADVINDAWGGWDPEVPAVVAAHGAGLVLTHTGGQVVRTRPHRVEYDDVLASVVDSLTSQAEGALAVGVSRERIVIDPAHDFGKNTRHSLECTRRLGELVALGWPVLVSLSNKDFVGESLGRDVGERVPGTLATTAISAWLGAHVYRVHEVRETRDVLDMVSVISGDLAPMRTTRGLA
jgi:Dihydropteroate synthase (EC 2.5.1.15)